MRIVSNDKFMDHRVKMKPQTLSYFERWLLQHQVVVHWYDRNRMKLLPEVRKIIADMNNKLLWFVSELPKKYLKRGGPVVKVAFYNKLSWLCLNYVKDISKVVVQCR